MKRIAVLCCDYPLHTAALVLNSIEEFVDRGMHIDIFCNSAMDAPVFPSSYPVTVNVYREAFWDKVFRKLSTFPIIRHMLFPRMIRDIARLSPYWASFARYVKRLDLDAYDYILCISYPALFCVAAKRHSGKCIYYNMELLDDTPDAAGIYIDKNLCRKLEHDCLRRVSHTVAMSLDRARIFQRQTQTPESRISVLPILPRTKELGERSPSNFFRAKFSLKPDQKIVVYSGGIGDWAMLEEIVRTVPAWPEAYVLVIHTWQQYAFESPYGKRLLDAARGLPVFFSAESLSRSQLISALSAADIGIAYYRELDDNFTNIVFSSNKICEYLIAGLPVLCSPLPSLKKEIDSHNLGRAVPISQIPAAIRELGAHKDSLAASIAKSLTEELNFDKYFEKFYRKIV